MKNFLIRWCFVVAFLPIPSVMAQTTSQQSLIDGILSDNKSNASPNSIPAVESAATRVNDGRPAPTGVRRVTALLLAKTATRLQVFNAHDRSSTQCDFVWPYSGTVVDTQMAGSSTDRPQRGAITFIWTGSCNSNGMMQGIGGLYIGKVPDSANDAQQFKSDPSKFIEQIQFDNGTQKGNIVSWRAQYTTDVDFSGNAENFKFSDVAYAKGSICHAIGFLSCRNLETINSRFTWIAGAVHPSWYKDSAKAYTCSSSGQSDEQCIWASRNYTSFYNQYKSVLAQGQCREMARWAAEIKLKGGIEQSSYEEETCQANSQLAAVLSGRDPQAMYLAAARYENNNDRPRAKRIYLTLMEKFPKSGVSVNAADRLSRLSDVEAVESATSQAASRAANASFSAAESVRKQNYDQCMNDRLACRDRCYSIRDSSAKSRCQDSCPLCSQ